MVYVLYGLAYLAYAFIQASVQVKLGHRVDDDFNPSRDLIVFMIFAPLISIFWILAGTFYYPVIGFIAYAERIAPRDRS